MSSSRFAIFAPTAVVSGLTLYGSWIARKISSMRGCTMRRPSRRPAAASTFENVFVTMMFGWSAIRGTTELPAKSLYASSTRTTVSG